MNNVRIVGPESMGVFSPNRCKLGVHPDLFFRSGNVGIVARGVRSSTRFRASSWPRASACPPALT
jgi:succinyl-CoA synthetase alpha subunit